MLCPGWIRMAHAPLELLLLQACRVHVRLLYHPCPYLILFPLVPSAPYRSLPPKTAQAGTLFSCLTTVSPFPGSLWDVMCNECVTKEKVSKIIDLFFLSEHVVWGRGRTPSVAFLCVPDWLSLFHLLPLVVY